ncbi:MAG TPA: DUF4276 family protein [Flavilitoribacter sp.]|nr:DUF4276 family protein [Flavilitoribacter sp.]HMQ90131.1 DUF4276 family protein [Flavilitoribacter sp.]
MTTFLHVFTEEPSCKNVFEVLLPNILPEHISFNIYSHQGKQDLKKALGRTLPTISKIPGSKILVTRDQDSASCIDVKRQLDEIVNENCSCDYRIRIVCRELESWFLGDLSAIEKAYPRFKPSQISNKSELRDVDEINNPKEFLLKNIPEFSGRQYLPKLEFSSSIAPFMDLEKNKSKSFNHTISAIKELIS